MSLRIVLVDDDATTLRVLGTLLTSEGHSVAAFEAPAGALAALDHGDYDVLLTDLVMPDMSGVDLVRAARVLHPHLRCFIVSGHRPLAGQDDDVTWVDKPIDVDDFLTKLA